MSRIQLPRRACDRGQAAVEFALVLPVLLILVLSIFEFGRAWSIQQVLTDTSRAGARRAVIADPQASLPDSVRVLVQERLSGAGLDTTQVVLTLNVDQDKGTGSADTVAIAYPYQFRYLGRLLQWASGAESISLTAQSVMRNE